jgi:uncharacterized protein
MTGQSKLSTGAQAERNYRRQITWWFVAAFVPFYLNDVLYLVVTSWSAAVAIDYGTRILVLLILVVHAPVRALALKSEEPLLTLESRWICAAIALVLMVIVFYVSSWLLPQWTHNTGSGVYLPVDSHGLYVFDMIAGLALVALSEELLGRRVAFRVLSLYTSRRWMIIVISSVVFGLMHWSNGVANVLTSSIAGVVFMVLYLRTGSLWTCIAVHYVFNFLVFSHLLHSLLPAD